MSHNKIGLKSLRVGISVFTLFLSLSLSLFLFNKAPFVLQSRNAAQIEMSSQTNASPLIIKPQKSVGLKYDMELISAPLAQAQHNVSGSRDKIVCVIDTGIDIKHPALKNNLWINPGEGCESKSQKGVFRLCEKSYNGVDDDGNGYIDDVHGWNFVSNNNDIKDNHGHGTHISGIIGAEGVNKIVSGVATKISLAIAKYYDPHAPGASNLSNTIKAIRYCEKIGASIINYSGGGLEPSELEKEAIKNARDKDGKPILFVAAAGNERSNSDVKKYYPAGYNLPNIISVTAIDSEKKVLDSSNFGEMSVDLAAPGKDIYNAIPGGQYRTMTGTSQATAFVTGAAVLVKSRFPDYDATQIIQALKESGDFDPTRLRGKTNSQKRLNIYRALAIAGQGTNLTGAIPKNTLDIPANQFSTSEFSRETASAKDDQFAQFIKNAREALEKSAALNGNTAQVP